MIAIKESKIIGRILPIIFLIFLVTCKKNSLDDTQNVNYQPAEPVWLKVFSLEDNQNSAWTYTFDVSGFEKNIDIVDLYHTPYPWQGEQEIHFRWDNNLLYVNDEPVGISVSGHDGVSKTRLQVDHPEKILCVYCGFDIPELDKFPNLKLVSTKLIYENLTSNDWKQLKKIPDDVQIFLFLGGYSFLLPEEGTDSDQYKKITKFNNITGINLFEFDSENLDDLIGALRGLENLRILNIQQDIHMQTSYVTEKGLEYIGTFNELRELQITIRADNKDLKYLRNLKKLRRLIIDGQFIEDGLVLNDVGIEHIANIPNLRELHLKSFWGFDISEEGWSKLASLPNLHIVRFQTSLLDEADIKGLSHLTNIRLLFLPKISESDLEFLKQALPDCEINTP